MSTLKYNVKYRKNEGLVISPEELTSLYFYGISTRAKDGSQLSDSTIRMYILAAQQEIEKYLEIRFNKKLIEQTCTYYKDDYWDGFPVLHTKLPVVTPLSMIGFLNNIEQIKYPKDWMNTKKDSEGHFYKKINLIPTGSTTSRANADIILTGITAYLGLTSYGQVPNYFTIQYITGYSYDDLPMDLINLVGKLASIGLFAVLGDIILGSPGITGISLGMDGLSQSINTSMSTGNHAFASRVKQYKEDINESLGKIKAFYKGISISVL